MEKMNDDKMKEILFKHGLDKLLTEDCIILSLLVVATDIV